MCAPGEPPARSDQWRAGAARTLSAVLLAPRRHPRRRRRAPGAPGRHRPAPRTPPPTTAPAGRPHRSPPTTPAAPAAGRPAWLVPDPGRLRRPAAARRRVRRHARRDRDAVRRGAEETANQTARFRLDQARAGDVGRFSYNGFIDVRYGLDTKDLDDGRPVPRRRQRRPGGRRAGLDDPPARAVLRRRRRHRRLRARRHVSGGRRPDPHDERRRDAGRRQRRRPVARRRRAGCCGRSCCRSAWRSPIVFALAAVRWLITGVGKGVGSVVRTASEPREVRAAMRSRPER